MENIHSSALTLQFRTSKLPVTGPIHYAIGHCVQGAILVARSTQGICAIFLDDDAPGLRRQIAAAFPNVSLQEASQSLHNDLERVIHYIDKQVVDAPIVLDLGGTPFQQRVWSALCEIPVGQTRSYTQLAQSIGAPKAVRAVASACAANTLAIIVPCHRIVRSDGSVSGYRWGAERKRELLRREAS